MEGRRMTESTGISLDHLRVLAERAGLTLTTEELASLKPMFDHYAQQVHALYDVELDAEDLAVVYNPNWDPQS
jgi:hypothetical protein